MPTIKDLIDNKTLLFRFSFFLTDQQGENMEGKMTKCSKCNSDNVFVKNIGIGWGTGIMVGLGSGWSSGMESTTEWETYLCTDCGYFENYMTKKDWLTRIKSDPKKEGWRKSE